MSSLPRLLDASAAFDAEYGHGLSNHLPMALAALARLGADDARLVAFARQYQQRLAPAPPAADWPAGEPWALLLGRRDAWPQYRDLFWCWLQTEDAGEVLRQSLPRLMQGCGGAAFHGLIRTAYAVQTRRARELADALAYWACRWLDLRPASAAPPAAGRVSDPEPLLRRLRVVQSTGNLIFERMQDAARSPHLQRTAAQLQVHPGTLTRLAELAAQAYAASGNFTALHLVTSAHALRVLMPFIDEPEDAEQAVTAYWQAYAAAVCVAGLRESPAPSPQGWPELLAAACGSDDDHVIKLVDSCHEQQKALGGGRFWQQAAARALATG